MRTVIRYIRFVAMALLAHPATAYTQSVDHLERGDRLRVTWDDGAGYSVGFNSYRVTSIDLVRVEDDLIIGQSRGQMVILNRQRVRSVERRIGTKPASAPTMVIGSAGGFAAGFLAGVFKATIDPTVTGSGDVLNDGIVSGVLVGAPAGALLAWIFSRQRGIYERIELGRVRPSVAVSWSNGTELGVRIPTR